MIETKLPDGALVQDVKYLSRGLVTVPYVRIPYEYEPTSLDVRAIADTTARFLSDRHLGTSNETKQQEIVEVKLDEEQKNTALKYGAPDAMYLVQHRMVSSSEVPVINYLVVKSKPVPINGIWGFVYIFTSNTCVFDEGTL